MKTPPPNSLKRFMLFITICLSRNSFGQITESFDALADGSYGDTEQTHAFDSGQWASLACIINTEKDRGDSGRAVRFRHDNDVKSYLEFRGENANGISSGIGTVSFWTRHWNDNGGTGVSFQVQYKQKDASTWTTVGSETEVTSASYVQQSFTVNQAANDLYLRIISVQNANRLLLDDFELTGYTLGLDTPQHPVLLYPNPAYRVVYIQGSRPPEKVQLYTLNGQLVDEHVRSKAIAVRDLHSGVYLVKIHTASQVVSRKLVVY